MTKTQSAVLDFFRQHGPMTCAQAIDNGITVICNVSSHESARVLIRNMHQLGMLRRKATGTYHRITFGGKAQAKGAKVFVYSAAKTETAR